MAEQAKPNWNQIKAEYLSGGISYRKLCEKYDVPLSTLKRKAKEENWVELKNQVEHKIGDAVADRVVVNEVKKTVVFDTLVDEMMLRVAEAISTVDTKNAKAVNLLADALGKLQRIKGYDRSNLDDEEQKARIASLRAKSENKNEDAGEMVIRIEGDPDGEKLREL